MKHPALTRVSALILAILCLVMLIAGAGSMRAAGSEREKALSELQRLTDRIGEYRELLGSLEGQSTYESLMTPLRQRQKEHAEKARKHRMDLAAYTASRAGVTLALQALEQAEAMFRTGWHQYEDGLKEFEKQEAAFWEGYRQFQEGKAQLAAGREKLQIYLDLASGVRTQLNSYRTMDALLDEADPERRLELSLAAYDGALAAVDVASQLVDSLKSQGGISAEQMQSLVEILREQEGLKDLDLSGIQLEPVTAEQIQAMEDAFTQATGLSPGELRQRIQDQRNEIASREGDEPLSEDAFRAICAAYAPIRHYVLRLLEEMEKLFSRYEEAVNGAKAKLDEAQAQIDQMEPLMAAGKEGIKQGRKALDEAGEQIRQAAQTLYDGRAMIWWQNGELRKQAEKLRQEKEELEAEARELSADKAEAERRKDQEQRERAVRLMLEEREDVARLMEGGMDLLTAAETAAEQIREQADTMCRGRRTAAMLMIAGALLGFAGIPTAFERTRSRLLLQVPPVLCAACAAGAELLCRELGRGDSYAALAAGGAALIHLLISMPKTKPAPTR